MTILVTGFEPFGGQAVNPSWRAVCGLDHRDVSGAEIVRAMLPVRWFDAVDALREQVEAAKPDRILLTGQAGGAECVRIERVGINLCNGTDNAGVELLDVPVIAGGAVGRFSSFDYANIKRALDEAQVPNQYSFSAGTYLCNHVLYAALHKFPAIPCGFIHLPYMEGQAEGAPFMALADQVRALGKIVEVMAQ